MQLDLNELVKREESSYYVLAGAVTLVSILNRFINETGTKYFDAPSLQDFFSYKCNRFLHSYGLNIAPSTKMNDKFNSKVAESLKKLRPIPAFNKTKIYLDSGGFQVSVGRVKKDIIPDMISCYHNFLNENSELFDYAFSLDLVPGPNCVSFSTFNDVLESNFKSYMMSSELKTDVRRKIIYIHHFRTPKLLSIFREILFESDLFERFDHFATGGIVANMASDTSVNVILYIIPLIDLLYQAKKYNKRRLNFHILGGASYRDIFFYELVKYHVKEVHNIDLKITFDSSSIFKGLLIARYIHVLEEDRILDMTLKEKQLGTRWINDKTISVRLQEIMDDFLQRNKFSKVDFSNPYDSKTGTFKKECSIFLMLYILDFYFEIQKYLRNKAKDVYKIFSQGEIPEFNSRVEKIIRSLNKGKLTRKQKSKSYSIHRSLQALTELDIDYANHLVNKFLSRDEFTNLLGNQNLLTF